MTRTYRLLRYVPDPVRGEAVNVGLVAHVDGNTRVMALHGPELVARLRAVAPHVEIASASHFVDELRSAGDSTERVERFLTVFNPHVRIEEPRRISSSIDVETALANAFRDLVSRPPPVKGQRAPKTTVKAAISDFAERAPRVRAILRQDVVVQEHPGLFGIDPSSGELFSSSVALPAFMFDAVLPNHTRVAAFRGFVASEDAPMPAYFESRALLARAKEYFGAATTTKEVFTGALLLPHPTKHASSATREGMLDALQTTVSEIETPVLGRRTAVFDLSNPIDEKYIEELALYLAHAGA